MVVKRGIIIYPSILMTVHGIGLFICSGKLEKFEIPAAVKLCSEVWSPDMGLVTAAFKLKRKDIQDRYQHEINRMYAS
jgi:long-subunit acyl-CoA synthetase (AMP-forming)